MRLLVALALVLGLTAAAEPKTTLPDIEDEVMCVECRTALNISTSAVADQERAFIRARIAEGMTKDEIKNALVDEYGPAVLAEPGDEGFDLAGWLVPGAIVALAGARPWCWWRAAGAAHLSPAPPSPNRSSIRPTPGGSTPS